MNLAPRIGINGKGERIEQGSLATITTDDGSKISGEVDFVGGHHQTAVIRKDGYTYIGDTRTVEKGNTTGRD